MHRVVVFGPVGSGKSTLVARLSSDTTLVSTEPLERMRASGLLDDLYRGVTGAAYRLQRLMIAERYVSEICLDAQLVQRNTACLVVTDGSIETDGHVYVRNMHAKTGAMTIDEQDRYWTELKTVCPMITDSRVKTYIYLSSSSETNSVRVQKRDRSEERQLDKLFFTFNAHACAETAEALLRCGEQIFTIDANLNCDEVERRVRAIIDAL